MEFIIIINATVTKLESERGMLRLGRINYEGEGLALQYCRQACGDANYLQRDTDDSKSLSSRRHHSLFNKGSSLCINN